MARVLVATAIVCLCTAARAAEYRYIEPGSAYEYAVRTAPLPAESIGAVSVELFREARRLLAGDPGEPVVDTEPAAAVTSEKPPEGIVWNEASPAPFGATRGKPKDCACSTLVGDLTRERVSVLYLRRTFTIGPEQGQLKVLRLRARYQDGLVAWLNGVEIARRNVEPGAAADRVARRAHGPEWETFYVPVFPGLLVEGENQLILEARPGIARLAPTLDLELGAGEQARIVRGPIVQRVGETRATIVFETDVPARAEVAWGKSKGVYDTKVASTGGEAATRHEVDLTGLPAGAEVHYQVITAEERTAPLSFHTAAAPGEPVRFVVYGDVRSGHDTHAGILASIVEEAPDFVLSTGDLVLRGTDEADWQRFFAIAGPVVGRFPFYPVIGNHDLGVSGDGKRRFEDIFALWPAPAARPVGAAWYSFDVSDVHFVMLDSNRYDDDGQLEWLERDLESARRAGARAVFAATHHGPWARGPHGGSTQASTRYAPLLEKHDAAVIFSGHDHLYQRGKVGELTYVVSGGGGAPLYKARCRGSKKKDCAEDGAEVVKSEYHYVVVDVLDDHARLCAKKPDGTPLEECVTVPLGHSKE